MRNKKKEITKQTGTKEITKRTGTKEITVLNRKRNTYGIVSVYGYRQFPAPAPPTTTPDLQYTPTPTVLQILL